MAAEGIDTSTMLAWTVGFLAGAVVVAGLVATGSLSVQRHSCHHVTAQVAIGQRGVFFSRTLDGVWWRLRLRPCTRRCEDRSGWGDTPPDAGVREPRRPLGPGPGASAVRLDAPS